ncbi:MAG: crotonase/enoyl-CoA hydratase family protein [Desulfobacterales bacterium]|nr:crotonase/enoyl-CoA hydratase family protein [Desulfobacterales bacterium]
MSALDVNTEGHVLLMGLNRPEKRNAFDIGMYRELSTAYGRLHRDPELRCGVLYAAGDHFTAGLDLPQWADCFARGSFPELPEDGMDPLGLAPENQVGKPVVMAVQGICLTLGIELLLATDIRVAEKSARFGQIEIKRGIYPVGGATVRLFQEIGWGNAMRYLLTADEMTADEAFRLGLVQEVTEKGASLDRAMDIAQTISRQAPLGVAATLKSARLARAKGDQAAIQRLLPDLLPLMGSEDVKEGVASFLERREARFRGI